MRNLTEDFKKRVISQDKLLEYGFVKVNETDFHFEKILSDTNFKAVFDYIGGELYSKVIDLEFDEEYILVDVKTPIGKYAAEIKMEYEEIMHEVIDKCSSFEVFKYPQSMGLIDYIGGKYNSTLEFLWKKFPNYAVYRNTGTNKWYAILMIVEKSKIGISEDGEIEILVLKYPSDGLKKIIDNKIIFEGYHMNKNHWITIPLDGRIDDEKLFDYVDVSYNLVNH